MKLWHPRWDTLVMVLLAVLWMLMTTWLVSQYG